MNISSHVHNNDSLLYMTNQGFNLIAQVCRRTAGNNEKKMALKSNARATRGERTAPCASRSATCRSCSASSPWYRREENFCVTRGEVSACSPQIFLLGLDDTALCSSAQLGSSPERNSEFSCRFCL